MRREQVGLTQPGGAGRMGGDAEQRSHPVSQQHVLLSLAMAGRSPSPLSAQRVAPRRRGEGGMRGGGQSSALTVRESRV